MSATHSGGTCMHHCVVKQWNAAKPKVTQAKREGADGEWGRGTHRHHLRLCRVRQRTTIWRLPAKLHRLIRTRSAVSRHHCPPTCCAHHCSCLVGHRALKETGTCLVARARAYAACSCGQQRAGFAPGPSTALKTSEPSRAIYGGRPSLHQLSVAFCALWQCS